MKLKLILIILVVIGVVFLIWKVFLTPKTTQPVNRTQSYPNQIKESDPPEIISTKPEPLDHAIISTNEVVEITFNRPLQNVGEFKVKMEPKIEFKIELSQDRKTAKIKTAKPYELGAGYTLSIGPDTKFDGMGDWGKDQTFQFRTIKYSGV